MGFFDGDWRVYNTMALKGTGLVINTGAVINLDTTNSKFKFTPHNSTTQLEIDLLTFDTNKTEFSGSKTFANPSATYEVKGKTVQNTADLKIFIGSVKRTAGTNIDIESYIAVNFVFTNHFNGDWKIVKLQPNGSTNIHKNDTNLTILAGGTLRFTKNSDNQPEDLSIRVLQNGFRGNNGTYRVEGRMIIPGILFLGLLGKGNPPGEAHANHLPAGDDNTESFVAMRVG
jgi:hypothetical protein